MLLYPAQVLAAQDTDESALEQFDQAKAVRPAFDSPASVELRDAVRRMAMRPNDPVALSDAGHASLKLGDASAAQNFFNRANAIQPGNARTVAGLGSAMVRTENPFEALRYFDEALRLGASERSIALDRALAFDLLGNFARAHQDYQLAKTMGDSDELTRRYAMSLAMAGKVNEADTLLVPLLQRNDPEAWRARAMMLATRGQIKESVQIAQGFLSADAARRMEGYLRLMPNMTDAQRAAAMHFGHFPVGRIGEDSNEIRQIAAVSGNVKAPVPATGQDRLIPSGAPLGGAATKPVAAKNSTTKPKQESRKASQSNPAPGFSTASAQQKVNEAAKAKPVILVGANLPPPDVARPPVKVILPAALPSQPVKIAAASKETVTAPEKSQASTSSLDAIRQKQSATTALPAPTVSQPSTPAQEPVTTTAAKNISITGHVETDVKIAANPVEPSNSQLPQTKEIQGPALNGVTMVATIPSQPAENVASKVENNPVPVNTASFNLDAVVQAIEIPASEKQTVATVDLKAIQRMQPKTESESAGTVKDSKTGKPKVEPKTAPQPARIWVQVATGAEAALGGDYRRFAKKSPELFKGKEGWTSVWGKSSRLLVGPFPDTKAAKKWEADFRKDGGSGFVWNSENGTVVKKLGAK